MDLQTLYRIWKAHALITIQAATVHILQNQRLRKPLKEYRKLNNLTRVHPPLHPQSACVAGNILFIILGIFAMFICMIESSNYTG